MKKPIVAINCRAEILGAYDSITQCAELNGFPLLSIMNALRYKRVYKGGIMFVSQAEHRKHWEQGTLHLLQFKNRKDRTAERVEKMLKSRNLVREHWGKRMSEIQRQRIKDGTSSIWKATEKISQPVMCIETGQVFSSLTKAAESMGMARNSVVYSAKRGRPVKGYHFKYLTTTATSEAMLQINF